MNLAISDLKNSCKNHKLWRTFGYYEILTKFRRSIIGPFWLTLSMVIFIICLCIIMSSIFNQKIEDFTLSFQEEDILVLYTDGVTEMENKKQVEFSAERLMRIIDKASSRNAKTIVSEIIDSLNNFSDGLEPMDDQTLLLIKHIGKPN